MPSELRPRLEPHRVERQDQDRKSILVSDQESEGYLRHFHMEEEKLSAVLGARHTKLSHLEWRTIQTLQIQ